MHTFKQQNKKKSIQNRKTHTITFNSFFFTMWGKKYTFQIE